MATITVEFGDDAVEVKAGDTLTFGRSTDCTICLDPDDATISRLAGSVDHDNGTWWLTNRSSVRPLAVIDELGFRNVLAPGRRTAVEALVKVIVEGAQSNHTLQVSVSAPRVPSPQPSTPPAGLPTAVGESVTISPADRLAMLALFIGYLEDPPKYDPNPKTYAAAAARLGWPRTTLVKRIEYLRTRLDAAGVPNMMGWNALANLAEYALSRGLITKADLQLIRPKG